MVSAQCSSPGCPPVLLGLWTSSKYLGGVNVCASVDGAFTFSYTVMRTTNTHYDAIRARTVGLLVSSQQL